ncbi:MAG: tryptophan 7-halogenase [Clostridia bacterium]|nr:tryptophan 7-halogenase [Clostridia bacterium]
MANILVAGCGHGGVVAAWKLAAAGHAVTVYEKALRGALGHEAQDAFDAASMQYAGIEIPAHYWAENNRLTFIPLDADAPALTMPKVEPSKTLKADRRELIAYLISLAEAAGARFEFGCEITAPIVLGNRIAGFVTADGRQVVGDLVIDACGVHSPLRAQLPGFTMIEREPGPYAVLHAYRAYFRRDTQTRQPATPYNVYLTDDGTVGLSWVVTGETDVDILVARFGAVEAADLLHVMREFHARNPHLTMQQIRGGRTADIPVRQPLAMLVADGYAAVGDAAFMTHALKGSGIAYSLMAGTILAESVLADTSGFYTTETLWEYERRFFREIGFDACRIAIMKNLLPYIKAQEVSDLFRRGLLNSEEVAAFSGIKITKLIALANDKLRMLGEFPAFRTKLRNLIVWLGRFAVLEPSFPNKYTPEDAAKWTERYNEFFDSIRYRPQEDAPPAAQEQ